MSEAREREEIDPEEGEGVAAVAVTVAADDHSERHQTGEGETHGAVTHAERWEVSFRRVKSFQRKFGHCEVPFRYPEDSKLGRWGEYVRGLPCVFDCRQGRFLPTSSRIPEDIVSANAKGNV